MIKYILSRFLLFFLLKFFYILITNTGGQLQVFFGLSSYSGWYDISRFSLAGLELLLAAILINGIFYILALSDIPEIREQMNKYSLRHEVKYFFRSFFNIAGDNLNHEIQREKSTGSFSVFAIIFLFFINSNSIFYNYTGVHKEYIEYTSAGDERIREEGGFILPKHEKEWISKQATRLFEEHHTWYEDEPDFELDTRNFLFVESGFIRGYMPKSRNDQFHRKGFWNYIRAIFIFSIEIFVITLLAFTFFLLLLGIKYYFEFKEG